MFWDYIKKYKGTLGSNNVQDTDKINERDFNEVYGSSIVYDIILDVRFVCVKK